MRRDDKYIPELVRAARAGDGQARERLVADYLPLVYNIVGRALDGHADVDDVVQETMFRALDGLSGLREPASFRSWLVAIAMNQIRQRWTAQQAAASLDRMAETPDPAGDFVDLTILRLGLSGQRREVAEATRWLDVSDRQLLALWWQEAAGQLTRAELAEALGVSPQHAAVRVQRMRAQLEVGRVVVRALAAEPYCAELALITGSWDGRPAPVWRKRIARHARECAACSGHRSELVPVEGLLAGLALVVPLYGYLSAQAGQSGPAVVALSGGSGQAPGRGFPSGSGEAPGRGFPSGGTAQAGRARVAVAVGGTVAGAILLALLWPAGPHPAEHHTTASSISTPASPALAATARRVRKTASTKERAVPKITHLATSPEQRLTGLVNARRAKAGCAPLRIDVRLGRAARRHAKDMVARGYFDHESPDGRHADSRISAAGYDWAMWAENLDRGTADPAAVVRDWMDGSIHQDNMLNCQYRDTGVAAVPGPGGMVWVQTLAKPA